MAELKKITPQLKFYYEVLDLKKRLDVLIKDFESSLPQGPERVIGQMIIRDPETGDPIEVKG